MACFEEDNLIRGMACFEEDNLVLFSHFSASQIWPDKRVAYVFHLHFSWITKIAQNKITFLFKWLH
jgi:hypothetical protein